VKLREVAGRAAVVMLWAPLWSAVAEARNPHCAGGIQYVVQATRDKEKGNADDYRREIGKAVQQLEICAKEDPNDVEAIGYLGWAYAEVDSACLAGRAFETAIKGLEAKGDKRKVEWATNNRNSYWAQAFNAGISKITVAQQAYPDFCKKPESEADQTLRAEAEKRYQEAEASLTRATCLRPGDAQTCRNLGAIFAFRCEYQKAEAVFREGLKLAPGDSALQQSLRAARVNYANQLAEEKKFDQASQFFQELIKAEPNDASHYVSLADVYFKRAQTLEGAPREADFGAAGDAYARAAQLKPGDADLAFNAALSYQSAKQWDKSEAQWAMAVKLRPEDADALSSWGSVLVELKRCDDAARAVHHAVVLKPQEKNLHRLLGNIYGKCGNDARGTDELIVFLAMHNGQPAADAGAAATKGARAGSDAGKTLAAEGTPDQVIPWEADNQKFETWLYWNKKRAFTFSGGTQYRTVDWSTAYTQPAAGGTADKKKK
jgi:tetratricopeptide (TPR) repeat protein